MIQKITQQEIDRDAVAALSDRPGSPSRYGTGGLTPGELKAHFDKLALLAIRKLNELIDALHGAGEGDALIDEMTTHAVSLADEHEHMPLSDWIERVEAFLGLDGSGGLDARVAALEALQIPTEEEVRLTGYHPDLVAGLSENLCGRERDATGVRLVRRPTQSAGNVGCGNAYIRSLHGSTLFWHQLAQPFDADHYSTIPDIAATVSYANGAVAFTAGARFGGVRLDTTFDVVAGHDYFVQFYTNDNQNIRLATANNELFFGTPGADFVPVGDRYKYAKIYRARTSGANNVLRIYDLRRSDWTEIRVEKMLFIDLTRMFGAGNEPATVDAWRAFFPRDDYAPEAGRLLHFTGTGLLTTGFNQYHDGTAAVLGKHVYQITGSYTTLSLDGSTVTPDENGLFTPTEAGTLTVTGGDDTTCVHLSWSGWRDGDCEAYWTRTLSLPVAEYFPDGMKSVGSVFDELTPTKAIRRIGTRAYAEGDESDATVVTDGETTCYVLASPEVTAIGWTPAYRVDDFGTEELLPINGTEPVTSPLTGRVLYALNAVDTLRTLPRDYVSLSSIDHLCTALSPWFTVTRTWNENDGDWHFTVTGNKHLYRATISVESGEPEELYTFTVITDAVPTYDLSLGELYDVPDGVYRAVTEYDHGVGDVVVNYGSIVLADGYLRSVSISTEILF